MKNLGADGADGKQEREIVPQSIAKLRKLLGDVVFLPCNQGPGGKGPILAEYAKLTVGNMTREHIAQCERLEYRIGVLFGRNSCGLCGLDCDCNDFADEMLRLNPWLKRTLTTTCNRGCTFWLRLTDCWPKKQTLFWRGFKSGEWRSDEHQSIVAGQDKDTKAWRRFITKEPVIPTSWRMLEWPAGMESGGAKTRQVWPPPSDTPTFFPDMEIADVERKDVEEGDVERRVRSTSIRARSTSREVELSERERKQERLYRGLVSHLRAPAGARNDLLNSAVPFLIHAVSEELVLAFHIRHFNEVGKPDGWDADQCEHEKSIRSLIAGCLASYPDRLGSAERAVYARLHDNDERAAFRICRDLSRFDDSEHGNPPGIFPLAYGELAARLDCSNGRAENLLKYRFNRELCLLDVETPGLPRQKGQRSIATRWRWMLSLEPAG